MMRWTSFICISFVSENIQFAEIRKKEVFTPIVGKFNVSSRKCKFELVTKLHQFLSASGKVNHKSLL